MTGVTEPALFLWVFLRNGEPLPTSDVDERTEVLSQFDRFANRYGLGPSDERCVDKINFDGLEKSPPGYKRLVRSRTAYPQSKTGAYYECLAFEYFDACILQIIITRFADWRSNLIEGWNEVTTALHSGFDGSVLRAAQKQTLGVAVVYWAIADNDCSIDAYAQEVRAIGEGKDMRRTATDLGGPLWRCERQIFPECPAISQHLWLLVTPSSADQQVNVRFSLPGLNSPSDFAVVALARHKVDYEYAEYRKERNNLEHIRKDLELCAQQTAEEQRRHGAEVYELRGRHSHDFQGRLALAGVKLADYRHSVSLLKELRRSIDINRRNYQINSVALVSSHGAQMVANSMDRGKAASDILANLQQDEIFAADVGQIQAICQQLESDIDNANSLTERHAALLRASTDQLRIAGERELGQMAHHLSIDSAAVVASIAAVIVVEAVLDHGHGDLRAWFLALLLIVGSFAATQVLASGCRGKWLERGSLALAIGLLGGYLGTLNLNAHWYRLLTYANLRGFPYVTMLIGIVFGGLSHWLIQVFARGRAAMIAIRDL
jgi:hypothetical protein